MLETVYKENFSKIDVKYDDPVLLSRNIYLTTDLDEKAATEIMMKLKYLESANNTEAVNLYIETCGGYGGVMLANYLQTIECPVNTIALGYCCSAGSELLASGTGKRKAFNSSKIIIHIIQDTSSDMDDETYNTASLQKKLPQISGKSIPNYRKSSIGPIWKNTIISLRKKRSILASLMKLSNNRRSW